MYIIYCSTGQFLLISVIICLMNSLHRFFQYIHFPHYCLQAAAVGITIHYVDSAAAVWITVHYQHNAAAVGISLHYAYCCSMDQCSAMTLYTHCDRPTETRSMLDLLYWADIKKTNLFIMLC